MVSFIYVFGFLTPIVVKENLEKIEKKYERVSRAYDLLDRFKIQIVPTELAMFQTLQPTLRQLGEVTEVAEESKEENIQKNSVELEKNIQELVAEVIAIRNRAQDQIILNPHSSPEDVLRFVDDLIEQADQKAEQAQRYSNYQVQFKMEPTRNTELEETRMDLALKKTLWVSLQDWLSITE